jgi:hypothetical protein
MSDRRLPPASLLVELLREDGAADLGVASDSPEVTEPVLALHRNNRSQWDREDDARADPEDDGILASAKRDIDRLNTARHRYIEAIDRAIVASGAALPGAPLVTESPGMAIDRLSVLIIRLGSTEARAASGSDDARRFADRLPTLRRQIGALEEAIQLLFDDLVQGNRSFVAYESLKLYGG